MVDPQAKLTEHFTIGEFCASERGAIEHIDNTPDSEIIESLRFTAAGLERIRAFLNNMPIRVLSGYRCAALNKAVGGAMFSQHMAGEAVDFVCPAFGNPKDIARHLSGVKEILGIDQLIYEGTWVHVSFTHSPRHQVLTFHEGRYLQGIV